MELVELSQRKTPASANSRGVTDWIGVDVSKGICSADDCEKNVLARGLCVTHYHRWHETVRPVDRGSRPCKGCGEPIYRTAEIGPIKHYHSPDCRPRCSVDDCQKPRHGKSMCAMHTERERRTGDPLTPLTIQHNVGNCTVEGCDQPMRKTGWCNSHYAQSRVTGRPPEPFKYKWGQAEPRPFIPKPNRKSSRTTCSVQGCITIAHAKSFCATHYTRFLKYGDAEFVQRVWREMQPCVVCGSESRSIKSRFLCSKRCEQLFYTYAGDIPTERECVQCGAITQLNELTRNGNRRRSNRLLCTPCQRSGWRSECLSVEELAERDGTDCSICHELVDMTLKRADSFLCPSIDHVIPRSRGGTNEPQNLALAHLSCNRQKSNKVA